MIAIKNYMLQASKNIIETQKVSILLVVLSLALVFGTSAYLDKTKELEEATNRNAMLLKKVDAYKQQLQQKYDVNVIIKFIQSKNPIVYNRLSQDIAAAIIKAEEEYDLPPYIMLLVIDVESDYRLFAKSKADAMGLCQINYKVWHKELAEQNIVHSVRELFDPQKNILAGAYILNKCLEKHKDWTLALQAYFGDLKDSGYFKKLLYSAGELYFKSTNMF